MGPYTSVTLINCGICFAIAVACYVTASALPLVALIFLMSATVKNKSERPTRPEGET